MVGAAKPSSANMPCDLPRESLVGLVNVSRRPSGLPRSAFFPSLSLFMPRASAKLCRICRSLASSCSGWKRSLAPGSASRANSSTCSRTFVGRSSRPLEPARATATPSTPLSSSPALAESRWSGVFDSSWFEYEGCAAAECEMVMCGVALAHSSCSVGESNSTCSAWPRLSAASPTTLSEKRSPTSGRSRSNCCWLGFETMVTWSAVRLSCLVRQCRPSSATLSRSRNKPQKSATPAAPGPTSQVAGFSSSAPDPRFAIPGLSRACSLLTAPLLAPTTPLATPTTPAPPTALPPIIAPSTPPKVCTFDCAMVDACCCRTAMYILTSTAASVAAYAS
mmetsp:Transcript_44977/g.101586  ORF Transcript_44977/g.101586 Transcript_44977/m.101586 type:complete len:336 (-) Transcript_44977:1224-2231(-)